MIAGMVEDDAACPSRRRAEAAADGLDEQHLRFRRLRVDDAADVEVDADGQGADIANRSRTSPRRNRSKMRSRSGRSVKHPYIRPRLPASTNRC